MGFHPLEHQIWKEIKPLELHDFEIVLAVSGGVDSMVLLEVFSCLMAVAKFKFKVCYIHHGLQIGSKNNYRNKAHDFVKSICESMSINFITNEIQAVKGSQSEEELRSIRQTFFKNELKNKLVVLGHHSEDLLETRLIRLVRGTGMSGLESMQFYDGKYLRPLLGVSKQEILEYAKVKDIKYIEDPSNKNEDYLRNWMRNSWLPQLEEKREGSLKTLAQSLEKIVVTDESKEIWSQFIENGSLNRARLMSLPVGLRPHCLAFYLNYLGSKSHSSNKISEILKRFDNNQKELSFEAVELSWKVTEKLISADKLW